MPSMISSFRSGIINRLGLDMISVDPKETKIKKVFLAALVGASLGAGSVFTGLKFNLSPIPIAIGALVGAIVGIALAILAIHRPFPIVYTEQKVHKGLNNLFNYVHLNIRDFNCEGIFRENSPPNSDLERKLMSQDFLTGTETPIEVSNLMKKYVAQLNIFQGRQQQLMEVADADHKEAINSLKKLFLNLSLENHMVLYKYIGTCKLVCDNTKTTRYEPASLSVVIGPSLCPDVLAGDPTMQTVEDIKKLNRATAFLIANYDDLFKSNNQIH